jgi:transposase
MRKHLDLALKPEILSRTPPEAIELKLRLLEENCALREENRKLILQVAVLQALVDELKAKLNQNSSNSNKPPSTDSPFIPKPEIRKKVKKPRKRLGSRQQCLRPTIVEEHLPATCSCGCQTFNQVEPYYVHQIIELPEIQMIVKHMLLHLGKCEHCGKTVKANIPPQQRTGFGPRLSALIVQFCGVHGDSRRATQDFVLSVLGVPISQGAIQNILERASQAIAPHYETIKAVVHAATVNHADETVWKQKKLLEWLWLLCNQKAAFFMLHGSRSKEAFASLVADWRGLLVSDDYVVYKNWEHGRQTCLAHLIRKARGLSERPSPYFSKPGAWLLNELRILCRMAQHPPSNGEWNTHCARIQRIIACNGSRNDEVGKLVRRIASELASLRMFLNHSGVAPTNNHAERTLRFAVLWRKRSFGTRADKGDRFVERILSLRQTCRLQRIRIFPVLVSAMDAFFRGVLPDTSWIWGEKNATP